MDGILPEVDRGLLRFTTAGSVDDGKSSLIGRLLYDAGAIADDQLAALQRAAAQRGESDIDLSLLTDGLTAEREQGITIDVAYRYFATRHRKFIIADTPGHEQYTRNMVTGASTADAAVVLIDVRKGMTAQTRRHLYLAHLLGIAHIIVAVNKMDLVGFAEPSFTAIAEEVMRFAESVGARRPVLVPISAKLGDNVVNRSLNLPWYQGPALLSILETLPAVADTAGAAFRMPVQMVQRISGPGGSTRTYLGRIEAGEIAVLDEILVLPAGTISRVAAIHTFDGAQETAAAPCSIAIEVTDDLDIARGDMLAAAGQPARVAQSFEAMLCWFADEPWKPGGRYLLKCGSRTVQMRIAALLHRVDITAVAANAAPAALARNDIARVRVVMASPIAFDAYRDNRSTGAFVLIDEQSNVTAAAGMIET